MSKKVVAHGGSDPRLSRLRMLVADKQAEDVCAALKTTWANGQAPARILFRRPFARLDNHVRGPVSDRKLPPRAKRPPSTRLIYPRGVAQPLYLTMIFVAQCERRPGQTASTGRPMTDRNPTQHSSLPWSDLVMVPAGRRSGKSYHRVEENRVRQLEEALKLLASDEIRLVDLPHRGEARGMLRDFVPLVESGLLGRASRPAYTVPTADDEVFSVPANFFLNGWHSALTPSELAMLFAIWASSPHDAASTSYVWLEGETRIRRFGLSPAAYGTQAFLSDLDVLDVRVPNERRPDGTFVGKKNGDSPLLNSFMIREAGFDKPAVPLVMAALNARCGSVAAAPK